MFWTGRALCLSVESLAIKDPLLFDNLLDFLRVWTGGQYKFPTGVRPIVLFIDRIWFSADFLLWRVHPFIHVS